MDGSKTQKLDPVGMGRCARIKGMRGLFVFCFIYIYLNELLMGRNIWMGLHSARERFKSFDREWGLLVA